MEKYNRIPVDNAIPDLIDGELYHCFLGKTKILCKWNKANLKMFRPGISGFISIDSVLLLEKPESFFFCDACGKEKEPNLDHCPCLEGSEWILK